MLIKEEIKKVNTKISKEEAKERKNRDTKKLKELNNKRNALIRRILTEGEVE